MIEGILLCAPLLLTLIFIIFDMRREYAKREAEYKKALADCLKITEAQKQAYINSIDSIIAQVEMLKPEKCDDPDCLACNPKIAIQSPSTKLH